MLINGNTEEMLLECLAVEIDLEIEVLEYELKIAKLNNRENDIEFLEWEIKKLQSELIGLGY